MTQRNKSPARRLAARTALVASIAGVGIALFAGASGRYTGSNSSARIPTAAAVEAPTPVSGFLVWVNSASTEAA
jgi:hypothetical protein